MLFSFTGLQIVGYARKAGCGRKAGTYNIPLPEPLLIGQLGNVIAEKRDSICQQQLEQDMAYCDLSSDDCGNSFPSLESFEEDDCESAVGSEIESLSTEVERDESIHVHVDTFV